jgi:hypothetical protein
MEQYQQPQWAIQTLNGAIFNQRQLQLTFKTLLLFYYFNQFNR